METTPTFHRLSRENNERLYEIEGRMLKAVELVAEVREQEYGEDLWDCAYPEAIFQVLDGISHRSAWPAVIQWLKQQVRNGFDYPCLTCLDCKRLVRDDDGRNKCSLDFRPRGFGCLNYIRISQ